MKKIPIIFLTILTITSCSQADKSTSEASENDTEAEVTQEAAIVSAVCIWDNLSVRDTPSSKGKWLTSISIGELLELNGEVAVDSADNNREYVKVTLADGKEGWTQKLLVVEGGVSAVFAQDAPIYKRPDLLTKSDKNFAWMDIVAVKNLQDEWAEVVGKRKDGTWIETGWVKKESLSTTQVDIATAKFSQLALAETDVEKRKVALTSIVENPDFASSTFMPKLQGELEGMTVADSLLVEDGSNSAEAPQ